MTHKKVVSNSTSLIALANINRFHILQELFGKIYIPTAVYNEVVTMGKGRAGSSELENATWIICCSVNNLSLVNFLNVSLDAGEAEAIALSQELTADLLLMDDKAGRYIAESVNISITGTVGLLLHYYQHSPLECKKAIHELLSSGFRLNSKVYNAIVSKIG